MTEKLFYHPVNFALDVQILAKRITEDMLQGNVYTAIYGIPRGGWMVATALSYELDLPLITDPWKSDDNLIVVDDVVDSGRTMEEHSELGLTVAIHKKPHSSIEPDIYINETDKWVVYFWERQEGQGVADNVTRLLEYIGEDPAREGLVDTPNRFVKAYDFLFSGYKTDPAALIKTFDEIDGYDEMIWLNNIELYSMCEHHMLPFFGRAHIAYIPDKRVIGISKLARLVDVFSRRLQIQERLTNDITSALEEHLKPLGCACVIEAQHLCMTMRGVQKQNSIMTTSSLRGVFMEKLAARNEFMSRIGKLER